MLQLSVANYHHGNCIMYTRQKIDSEYM